MKNFSFLLRLLTIVASMLSMSLATAAEMGKAFSSPEDAVNALAAAATTKDRAALKTIFGPATANLELPDPALADEELAEFTAAFNEAHHIMRESDTAAGLLVGNSNWPFPVPLLQKEGKWFFDTEAGIQEITNRRIGRNELSTLNGVRAYVEAQREYASKDRDADDVLEFAQHILSAPGLKDGLYWSPELDGEISPLGPLAAAAQAGGYVKSTGEKSGPRPFHGYYFKILTRQGKGAPGGKYNYIINGNMIGGFALIAWPAEYGDTGVMTFIVNQQGKVYQKDLGPKTASTAKAMKDYNPDSTWTVSPD